MFFKHAQVFKLQSLPALEELTKQLERMPFVECAASQPISLGFIPPKKDGSLIYSIGGQMMIALQVEQRILPSSVVADEVQKRAEAMTEQQGYAPGRKQIKELKERVIEELMPQAFKKRRVTHAWLDTKNGTMTVNASTNSKAEELIDCLRCALDEFPLKPLHTNVSPTSAMADWLAGGEAPDGFTIDRDCELKAVGEEKSSVAFKRHSLGDEVSDEIKSHLSSGKLPTKLALTWDDRISFVLHEDGSLKRLTFLDLIKEEADKNAETADEQFDADFALMTGEMSRLIENVIEALGGEVKDEQ